MKKFIKVISVVIILLLVVLVAGARYMVYFALTPRSGYDEKEEIAMHIENYPWQKEWVDSILTNEALKDTFVTNDEGLKIHAFYLPAPKTTTKTVVLVHGYKDCGIRMLRYAYFYNKYLDYNCFIPDLHAHGESQGDAIQMGWKDRLDIVRWIDVADDVFTSKGNIVVHGLSMGAATTMMVSGEESVQNKVKAFVEDCGYTSVWDEFTGELKNQFGLPSFPLLNASSCMCDLLYGWNFKEASALNQVRKCTRPMLFIHGDNDDFVPTQMVYPLYDAHRGPKQIWLAKGSIHAYAYKDHAEEYTQLVGGFLAKYVK